jgi:glutaredoxin
MRKRKPAYERIFVWVSSLAAAFVLAEAVLQSFGKSICRTEGCKVVAQHVRYGDISILVIGLATFTLLALLSFLGRSRGRTATGPFINLILIVSLASEGFFTGYQAFDIHTPCVFCLIIFGLIVLLGLLRLLAGERTMLAGFAALAAVFSMFYLVPPAEVHVNLPVNERFILFYSPECRHCTELMKQLEADKITVAHLDVKKYAGFLKDIGIEDVPTLFINDGPRKMFLTGEDEIRQYLTACTQTTRPGTGKRRAASGGNASKKDGSAAKPKVFNEQGFAPPFLQSAPAEGVCKATESCK